MLSCTFRFYKLRLQSQLNVKCFELHDSGLELEVRVKVFHPLRGVCLSMSYFNLSQEMHENYKEKKRIGPEEASPMPAPISTNDPPNPSLSMQRTLGPTYN